MTNQSLLSRAFEHYHRGALTEAEEIGRRLLPSAPKDAALNGLLGMITVQTGRASEAVPYLRVALQASPDTVPLRISLGFALANSGLFDEARHIASGYDIPQLQRIVAFSDQQQGRYEEAIAGYRRVLEGFPEDAESWNNLGLLLSNDGRLAEAVAALQQAIGLRQDPSFYVNLSQAYARGERHAERQSLLRDAAARNPGNVSLLVELGLAEGAVGDFAAAERAYRAALSIAPQQPRTYLEYGMMLESLNRIEDLTNLVEQARSRGLAAAQIDFLEAWLLKRTGRFAEALQLAERANGEVNASRRAQLIGELADRLDDTERAFNAFTEMNRLSAEGPAAAYARSLDFPAVVDATLRELDAERLAQWLPVQPACDPSAPVFLVGFPRSGTTLLDTLLMNLPELEILEEVPIVERTEELMGDASRLASLTIEDVVRLRSHYFDLMRESKPSADGSRTVVDKFPLNLVRAPLIYRLFPDARFIMVERHPCDVILSCFMSRFQTNRATVQFHDLVSAACLYDLSMQVWTKAEALLPLRVHRVRYERMVEDLAAEIRPLLSFLDLPWRSEVLDNQRSAMQRAHVPTASYAQVTEPIYDRARGRWQRYREHLKPVMPILAPWAESMGYSL